MPGPAICLNMIVRNEAHIISETLDSVARYIASWVIVDTGSDDGTQNLIREHMAGLGIPGYLHERRWRDFGHNRTEALDLARGHGDYIWVIDADDVVVGTLDFSELSGSGVDAYALRHLSDYSYWRRQLFRDGLPWRYVGVVHEHSTCDQPFIEKRLPGDYYIESRRLGARNLSPEKYARDRDLLLAEVERNPVDTRSVFYLAQSYFDLGDFDNARTWYARRAEMGGWDEEVYYAMFRVAECMSKLGEPWPDVQDEFLRAFEFRPIRAEPLHAIANRYRLDERYRLGYLFAKQAAGMALPVEETLFVNTEVYQWRALAEQAVCGYWIGKHVEAFTLWRKLLAQTGIAEGEREKLAENRDYAVPAMLDAASEYPQQVVERIATEPRGADVTVSLVAGPDRTRVEAALGSFLHCCLDVSRAGRFLVAAAGLSTPDRVALQSRYPFLEFTDAEAEAALAGRITDRFWLRIGAGWRFFAPEHLLTRLAAVLDAEPEVAGVGVNYQDAAALTGVCAPEGRVRRAPDAGRYVLAGTVVNGPAMLDTGRLGSTDPRMASLDEVLCIHGMVATSSI